MEDHSCGGEKLQQLFQALKEEKLQFRSDMMTQSKIESAQSQTRTKILNVLIALQDLLKKIETLEVNRESTNIENLLKDPPSKSPSMLPLQTQELIVDILHQIRVQPDYLIDALERDGWFRETFDSKYCSKMSRVIIFALFRNGCSPREERLCLRFLSELCKREVQRAKATSRIGTGIFFKNLFRSFVRMTGLTEHLRLTIEDLLMKIVENDEITKDELREVVADIKTKITSNIFRTPPVIRVIVKQIRRSGSEHGLSSEQEDQLIDELVFGQYYLLCFQDMTFFTSLSGVSITPQTSKNLNAAGDWLRVLVNEDLTAKSTFFDQLADVDLDGILDYESMIPSPFRAYVITKSELELLFQLLIKDIQAASAKRSRFSDTNDPLRELLDQFVALERQQGAQKTEYQGIYPGNLLGLYIREERAASTTGSDRKPTKEVKKVLWTVLAEVPLIPQFKGASVIDAVQSLCSSSWNKNQVSMWAQVNEIVRGLNDLPADCKENDFDLVLTEMWQDHRERVVSHQQTMKSLLLSWNQMQEYYHKVKCLRDLFMEQLTSIKVAEFWTKSFEAPYSKFLESFTQRFVRASDRPCECSLIADKTCDNCKHKSEKIKGVINFAKNLIKSHGLWQNASEEEINMAVKLIERKLIANIFDRLFRPISDDIQLSEGLDKLRSRDVSLQLADFDISPKYRSESPWYFAQAELRKINSFKSPYDKFLCISRCWEVISNCVSLLDDPGPDDCFPIMAFVVYSLARSSPDFMVYSNIKFIGSYCTTLQEYDQGRFAAFRTASRSVLRSMPSYLQKYLPTESPAESPTRGRHAIPLIMSGSRRSAWTAAKAAKSPRVQSFALNEGQKLATLQAGTARLERAAQQRRRSHSVE
eukprot:TRINITY_DN7674_c0_g1_i1.p1 TRINITY_DN7674_c0_g1~~TRINITY_DN7674_c0_g1_i1.p1  ORF type:complete len:874 (+),score=154.87 TRINITY_DN7674_c0_g1_i1:85-2706(+)